MQLDPHLLPVVKKAGWSSPTTIQSESIPVVLRGVDLIGIAQTGSGKTLAYALAVITLLMKKQLSRVLILTPSRETAEQVERVFKQLLGFDPSIISCLIATGTSTLEQIKILRKNPRIIVATPGRMSDHLRSNKLLLKGLEFLVIDEADRMLELGFEAQLKFIQSTLRGDRQTLMFAASFGKWTEAIAKMFLKPDYTLIKSEFAEMPVSTLKQKIIFLTSSQKNNRLLDELKKIKSGVIIFVDSQESCTGVGRLLEHRKLSSDFIHGDMNPGHRNRVLKEFRDQKIQILVTTDLLARGLDVDVVSHVINFDLPYKSEDFLHRIGRTARAGREGVAITFVTSGDGRTYRKIKKYVVGADEEVLARDFKFDD